VQFKEEMVVAKKTKSKKNEKDKSLLGQNSIFTPDIINDIHIKSGDKVEKGELIMDINN